MVNNNDNNKTDKLQLTKVNLKLLIGFLLMFVYNYYYNNNNNNYKSKDT